VKVADFGLAKSFENAGFSGTFTTTQIAGTPPYMAREQIVQFRFVKPPADVWSLAATLYTMLTGQFTRDFPPGKDPLAVILNEPVVPISKRDARLPKRLAETIDHALADDPKARPSAGELAHALQKAL
jgi:serine/threonine protein kinase